VANILLSDLKQMFRFALTCDLVVRNPLDTVNKRDVGGASVERDRVLTGDEIKQLRHSIEALALNPRFAAGIWLILAIVVRVRELLGAVWGAAPAVLPPDLRAGAERSRVKLGFVDLKRRSWYLPETKNQRDHTIHLSAFAKYQGIMTATPTPLDAGGAGGGGARGVMRVAQSCGELRGKRMPSTAPRAVGRRRTIIVCLASSGGHQLEVLAR